MCISYANISRLFQRRSQGTHPQISCYETTDDIGFESRCGPCLSRPMLWEQAMLAGGSLSISEQSYELPTQSPCYIGKSKAPFHKHTETELLVLELASNCLEAP